MKQSFKKLVCFLILAITLPLCAQASSQGKVRFDRKEHWIDGSRHVVYAQLETKDAALVPVISKINQSIRENVQIDAYIDTLAKLSQGGTGLIVEDSQVISSDSLYLDGEGYFYVLMEAEGKMPKGRPSHHYYPMLFDVASGERVSFEQLFINPDGAKEYIEAYLCDVVEPHLSSYMENNQLFPVPYENFGFSNSGHIVIYYPHDQLSFLSGKSGAVAFRYSELWDYLDISEDGIPMQMVKTGTQHQQYVQERDPVEMREIMTADPDSLPGYGNIIHSLGASMELVQKKHAVTTDSGFYPGGAYLETETPELLGAYLITDAAETYLSGILTSRIDMYGIETGKTTLDEATRLLGSPMATLPFDDAAAQMYLVCPGTAAIYSYASEFPIHKGNSGESSSSVTLTLYADTQNVVQYIKLSLN